MAMRRRRSFRRGRRGRPLLRWTAVNPEVDSEDIVPPETEVVFSHPIVTPDIYEQNEFVEPDGCVLKRCIIDVFYAGIYAVGTSGEPQPFGVGLFWDAAVIVGDVDAFNRPLLDTIQWSTTMTRERVLWHESRDFQFAAQPNAGASGTAGAAQLVTQAVANDLIETPHTRIDFNVNAKLMQNKAVVFVSHFLVGGQPGGSTISLTHRIQARALLGGRF